MIEKQYSHLTEKEIKKKTKDAIVRSSCIFAFLIMLI